MLTRLEVDGFKNLLGFTVEFGPFTCIAGANAVGKSNLFDAIEFLSLLADHTLDEAAARVRAPEAGRTLARDLFWTDGKRRAEAITLTADLIVEDVVYDDLGGVEHPQATTLRYHVELGYENGGHHRLVLLAERLSIVRDLTEIVRFPHGDGFVAAHHIGRISSHTDRDTIIDMKIGGASADIVDGTTFAVVPVKDARRTLLSSVTRAEPTLLAVREELRRWRRLALEPAAIAAPVSFGGSDQLAAHGGNLPRVLDRIVSSPAGWGPEDPDWAELTYAKIIARLSALAPVQRIWVHEDTDGGQLSIRAQLRDGEIVPARALSDGTLRFLALAVLSLDPSQRLLCIEEPENGLHPAQMHDLVELLRDLATDPRSNVEAPLRQIIFNTHSPLLVQAICAANPEDVLIGNTVTKSGPHQQAANVLQLAPLRGTWRCHDGVRGLGRVWLGAYSGHMPSEEAP